MKIFIKLILATFLVVLSMSLMSCHTAQGFGEDLQAGGSAISNAAANNL
jgi:predicted small secreted protein